VAVVFVIFVGYLLVRQMTDDPERGARFAAVVGVLGALNIPLVHFSVYWWRTLHQPPSVLKPGPSTMPPAILAALLVNLAAFTLLYVYFVAKRMRLLRAESEALA
jgi:heme exporter protein C